MPSVVLQKNVSLRLAYDRCYYHSLISLLRRFFPRGESSGWSSLFKLEARSISRNFRKNLCVIDYGYRYLLLFPYYRRSNDNFDYKKKKEKTNRMDRRRERMFIKSVV